MSGPIRFAPQVLDSHAALDRLVAGGATIVHPQLYLHGSIITCVHKTKTGYKSRYSKFSIKRGSGQTTSMSLHLMLLAACGQYDVNYRESKSWQIDYVPGIAILKKEVFYAFD